MWSISKLLYTKKNPKKKWKKFVFFGWKFENFSLCKLKRFRTKSIHVPYRHYYTYNCDNISFSWLCLCCSEFKKNSQNFRTRERLLAFEVFSRHVKSWWLQIQVKHVLNTHIDAWLTFSKWFSTVTKSLKMKTAAPFKGLSVMSK